MSPASPTAVDHNTYIEIQRFLFREASLLDRRDYAAWLALATDDISYKVTAAVARESNAAPVQYAIIDEGMSGLKSRIEQVSNHRLTRAENPPSLTRRVVSNIEAYETETPQQFSVTSYLLAYRSRPSAPEGGFYVAVRHDTLRRAPDWRLASRNVQLDHIMLYDGALSTLL